MVNGVSVPIHDALAQFDALPSNASLTASEAALFLRSSVTTLERMRKSGIGPAWIANAGAKGSSSVAYVKQDLIVWMAANKAGGPVAVAVAVASAAPPPSAGAITLTHEDLNRLHRHFINLMCNDSGPLALAKNGGKPAVYNFSAFLVEWKGVWVAITAGHVFGDLQKAVAAGSVLSNWHIDDSMADGHGDPPYPISLDL